VSPFLEGKTTKENLPVKRFGYLISALFLVTAVIGMINMWSVTPLLFLITLYLLTGSLWIPALVRPLYRLFGKYIVKPDEDDQDSDTFFNAN